MNELFWYLARGTGITAFLALTATLSLGVLGRSGRDVAGMGRFGIQELHRTMAYAAIGLLLTHVTSLLLDSESGIHLVNTLVPFTGGYRPLWVGLGVLAVYLLGLATATGLLRGRLSPRGFRVLHATTYLLWPLAALHFLNAGTDGRTLWALALLAVCTVTVAGAAAWRLSPGVAGRGHQRLARRTPVPVRVTHD